jgi:hypothetical protein
MKNITRTTHNEQKGENSQEVAVAEIVAVVVASIIGLVCVIAGVFQVQ